MSTRACGSPKPGTGRPQYVSSRNDARFSRATCSRHSTRRGHARHPTISSVERAQSAGRARAGVTPRSVTAIGFAAVRVLLVVNPAASSVTTRARVGVERILRGPSHDSTSWRRRAAATRSSSPRDAVRRGLRRRRRARRRRHAQRGRRRARRVRRSRWRRCPAARRTCSRARSASPTTPTTPPRQLRRRRSGAVVPPHRPRRGHATRRRRARHFLFHLGVGFDAAIIRRMEARSYLKRYFAHPAFAVATVDTWLRHYDRAHSASGRRASTDRRRRRRGRASGPYAVISNSDPYTYVGRRPLRIAPDASLDRRAHRHRADEPAAPAGAAGGRVGRRHGSLPGHLARDRAGRRRRRACRSAATARSPGRSTATTSARSTSSRSAYRPDSLTVVTP